MPLLLVSCHTLTLKIHIFRTCCHWERIPRLSMDLTERGKRKATSEELQQIRDEGEKFHYDSYFGQYDEEISQNSAPIETIISNLKLASQFIGQILTSSDWNNWEGGYATGIINHSTAMVPSERASFLFPSGGHASGSASISEASEYSEASPVQWLDYPCIELPSPNNLHESDFNAWETGSATTISRDVGILSLDSAAATPSPSYMSSRAFETDPNSVAGPSHILDHPNPSTAHPPAKRMRTGYNPPLRPVKVGIKNIAWTDNVTAEMCATISEMMGSAADGVTTLPSFYAIREGGRNVIPFAYFIAPSIDWARWFCTAWNQTVVDTIWRDSSAFYEIL